MHVLLLQWMSEYCIVFLSWIASHWTLCRRDMHVLLGIRWKSVEVHAYLLRVVYPMVPLHCAKNLLRPCQLEKPTTYVKCDSRAFCWQTHFGENAFAPRFGQSVVLIVKISARKKWLYSRKKAVCARKIAWTLCVIDKISWIALS